MLFSKHSIFFSFVVLVSDLHNLGTSGFSPNLVLLWIVVDHRYIFGYGGTVIILKHPNALKGRTVLSDSIS